MSFKIVLQPSGHGFETMGNESILDAAFRSGISLSYSCQNGSCGECRAKILDGEVRNIIHHDFTMSEAEKIQKTILMCCYKATSDCEIEAIETKSAADIPLQKIKVKVAKIESMSENYIDLQLRTPRTKALRFLAGQQLTMKLEGFEPFVGSIASCPCNGMILHIHLYKHDKHPFVRHAFNEMKVGESLTVEGPQGEFMLDEDSERPIVMVAVDTGFSAMKSIIEHAIALDLQQAIHLYWIVNEAHEHYHDNFCRSWELALETFMYQPMRLNPDESLGELISQVMARLPVETELDVYLSGQKRIIDRVRIAFEDAGTPTQRIFQENTPSID